MSTLKCKLHEIDDVAYLIHWYIPSTENSIWQVNTSSSKPIESLHSWMDMWMDTQVNGWFLYFPWIKGSGEEVELLIDHLACVSFNFHHNPSYFRQRYDLVLFLFIISLYKHVFTHSFAKILTTSIFGHQVFPEPSNVPCPHCSCPPWHRRPHPDPAAPELATCPSRGLPARGPFAGPVSVLIGQDPCLESCSVFWISPVPLWTQ